MISASCLWLALAAAHAAPALRPDPLQPAQDLFEARRYADAAASLQGAALHRFKGHDLARAYDLLGQAHEKSGRVDDAIAVYELGQGLFPKDINILTHLGDLLHHAGLDDRAAPLYARVLRIHPHNASANLGLAQIERRQGFLERAAGHYETALNTWPDNASLWRDFAEVLADRRDYARAETAIRKSISLAPLADSIADLAVFRHDSGSRKNALITLGKAIEAAPDRPEFGGRRALWLLESGELTASLAQAEALLKADDGYPVALWARACASLRLGDAAKARKDLETLAEEQTRAPFAAAVAKSMLELLGAPK